MAESRMTYNEIVYTGPTPTVFKKIDSSDVKINPFQSFKTWTVYSGSVTSSALPLIAIYSDATNLPSLGSELTFNDSSNIDGSLQTITYFSVNHQYYKYKKYPAQTFGPTNLNQTKKHLYQSASILSFPQIRVGEGIKPSSFTMTASFSFGSIYGVGLYGTSSYSYIFPLYIKSDRYGNLYNSAFDTQTIVTKSLMYEEGFNEYFDSSRVDYVSNNVTYIPGIPTTTGASSSYGYAANFNGNGFIKREIPGFYDRNHDYAISFFIRAENTGSDSNIIITKASSSLTTQYPFKISIDNAGYLEYYISANVGLNSSGFNPGLVLTSASPLDPVNYIHVVCQKSGSVMQLYTNGTLESSISNTLLIDTQSPLTASGRIDNKDPLFIGGFENGSNLTGTVDEIRIFNRALTATEIGYLADRTEGGSFMQTNHIGNVFARQGVAVISTPDYRFHDILNSPYTASYKSTITTYELGVMANVDAGDFNMSMNLTLTDDSDVNYKNFVTGSAFAPYITTIGLYNDSGQLLAIGKLAQPIRKRSDVDMNFLIRLDLDRNIS